MYVRKATGRRTATLPDGSILTQADLPAADTRWVARRKLTVVQAIRYGDQPEVKDKLFEVVDATGAGDLFAAGLLHGIVTGRDWETCARMGCVAAGEIIATVAAPPLVPRAVDAASLPIWAPPGL